MVRRIGDNGLILSLVKFNRKLELHFISDTIYSAQYTLYGTDGEDTVEMDCAREAAAGQPVVSLGLEMFLDNTKQWPRHLYMDCFRNTPIFRGDVGTLHIDVQEGTAFFGGWKSYETLPYGGVDSATHDLCIDRLNAKNETATAFRAHCSAPGWKTFGLDIAYFSFEKPAIKEMITIAHPHVIVDALVHCIDTVSRREAVHDPDMEHKLRTEVEEYKVLQKIGGLGTRSSADWEWTVMELKRRRSIGKRLRVVEGNQRKAPTEVKDLRELIQEEQ